MFTVQSENYKSNKIINYPSDCVQQRMHKNSTEAFNQLAAIKHV